MKFEIELQDGKYTYIYDGKGNQIALRYGEGWRDLCGDSFVYAMAAKIRDQEAELEVFREQTASQCECTPACGDAEDCIPCGIIQMAKEASDE